MSTHKHPHQRIRLGHPNYGTEGRRLLQWPLVLGGAELGTGEEAEKGKGLAPTLPIYLYTLAVSPSLGGSRQHKRDNKNNGDFTLFF